MASCWRAAYCITVWSARCAQFVARREWGNTSENSQHSAFTSPLPLYSILNNCKFFGVADRWFTRPHHHLRFWSGWSGMSDFNSLNSLARSLHKQSRVAGSCQNKCEQAHFLIWLTSSAFNCRSLPSCCQKGWYHLWPLMCEGNVTLHLYISV